MKHKIQTNYFLVSEFYRHEQHPGEHHPRHHDRRVRCVLRQDSRPGGNWNLAS